MINYNKFHVNKLQLLGGYLHMYIYRLRNGVVSEWISQNVFQTGSVSLRIVIIALDMG